MLAVDCERFANDLTAYLDRELSDARMIEVKSHLEICDCCRKEYRSLELSARFIETHAREMQPAPEIWKRVRSKISSMEAPAPAPGLLQFLVASPWWSGAATIAAMAVCAFGIWSYTQNQAAKRDLIQYMTRYVQVREAEEQTHRTEAAVTPGADPDSFIRAKYSDNPFVTMDSTPDKNPFRSEDQ